MVLTNGGGGVRAALFYLIQKSSALQSLFRNSPYWFTFIKSNCDTTMDISAPSTICCIGFADFRWHHGLYHNRRIFFYGGSLHDDYFNYHGRI